MRTGSLGQSNRELGLQQGYGRKLKGNYELLDYSLLDNACLFIILAILFQYIAMAVKWKSTLFSQHVFFLRNINMEKEITKALD